jgi:predicted Zn-dependent protease
MSKQIKQQYGAQVLGGVLSVAGADANLSTLAQTGYGLGAQFSSLHYSRSHENEADYMGLIFAAMAGYDPSVAITFWQRMASGKTSSQPEFLSTHPSDATRISNIKKRLPDAQKYYKK